MTDSNFYRRPVTTFCLAIATVLLAALLLVAPALAERDNPTDVMSGRWKCVTDCAGELIIFSDNPRVGATFSAQPYGNFVYGQCTYTSAMGPTMWDMYRTFEVVGTHKYLFWGFAWRLDEGAEPKCSQGKWIPAGWIVDTAIMPYHMSVKGVPSYRMTLVKENG